MKKLQKFCISSLAVVAAFAVSVTSANAFSSQSQWQGFSSETSFSSSCEGSNCGGKTEFKSSTTMEQAQTQSTGSGRGGDTWGNWDKPKHHNNDWGGWDDDENNTNGEVRISWPQRDGTCKIQYKMVGQSGWPYSTEASCNDGAKTIGGLEEGKRYQFRVKKDGENKWYTIRATRAQ
jgi:hypothetical protein